MTGKTRNETNYFFGITIVVLSSLCFAVVPTVAKTALDLGSSLFVLLFSRCLIGLFVLIPVLLFQKKSILIHRSFILPILFSSLISVSLIATIYHAIEFLEIAIVLIIMYSFPLGIAVITCLRSEEEIKFLQWVCLIGIILGLAIVVFNGTFTSNPYGIGISFFGLFLMVIFIYNSSKIAHILGSETFNFHMNLWSLLFLASGYFLLDFAVLIPSSVAGKSALFCNGLFYILSYTLFFIGSQKIGITRASVLTSTEPLFAATFALIFLNQSLTFFECIGFFIVISSLYFYERHKT